MNCARISTAISLLLLTALTGCGATPPYDGISERAPEFGSWLTESEDRRFVDDQGFDVSVRYRRPDVVIQRGDGTLVLRECSRADHITLVESERGHTCDLGAGRLLTIQRHRVRVDDLSLKIPKEGVSDVEVGLPSEIHEGLLRRGGGVAIRRAWFSASRNGELRIETAHGPIRISNAVDLVGLRFRIEDPDLPIVDFTLQDEREARLYGDRLQVGSRTIEAGSRL